MFVCTTPVVFGAAPRGITISGTIVNSDNEPIEYPVVSYGSGADTKGQQADLNGKFTLDVPSMDTVVTIYGMGYQSKTLKASELNGQIVALKDDKQFLEASVSTDCSTQQRTKKELHATQLEYIKSADKCVPKICATEENGKGYLLENGGTANAKCTPCKIDGAITTAVKDNVCVATSCQKQYYDPATKNGQCVSKVGEDCLSEIRDQNATVAKYNDRGNCDLKSCKDGYAVKGQSCDPQIDKACPKSTLQSVTGDKNATSGTITSFVNNEIKSCKITACANGWRVNKTTNKCDQICTPDAIKQLQNAGANETKVDGDKCVAKSCRCGYTLNQSLGQCNKWTTAEEKCEPKSAGATAGKYVCNDEKQVCTITTCDTKNYDMVGDGINA